LVPLDATAVRLTTNAQGVRQFDVFTEPPPYIRSDDGATSHTTIEVPANDALFQESLTGSTDLVKTGPGTLSLIDAATHGGATRILDGTLKLHPPLSAPVSGYSRRFDASTLALADGAAVSQWNDLSPNNAHATPQTGNPPTFTANAVNGLGAVAFTGTAANTSQSLNFTRASNIRTAFSIFHGGSFLLTDTVSFDFHRPDNTNPASPIWAPVASNWTNSNITGGRTYINGAQVDGSSFNLPTATHNGFNQITLVTNGPVRADGFNRDRIYHAGNQTHAEVILYDTTLTEAQRLGTERYLRTKWFGEAPVTSILPSGTALSVENEGIFDLNGASQSVASLAIAPDAAVLLNGGHLTITGSGGSAVVQGSLTGIGSVTNTGTLRLTGDAVLDITGTLINTGVLDIMTWSGTLPSAFVNNGIVLDRSAVKIDAFEKAGNAFAVTLKAHSGHAYQLQRSESLSGVWQNIGTARQGDDTVITLTDPDASTQPRMFYRVSLQP
jgi:autotransporter-associated beta strand protein